MPTAAVLG